MNDQSYSTYLLLDASQMRNIQNPPWLKDRRCRGWMERIYERRAVSVSPILIDIDAAYHKGRIAEVMEFVAACNPKFHVSIIDSGISLQELAIHLRQLIYIVDETGQEFTLRFADGAVLPALFEVLAPQQRQVALRPIMAWRTYDMENNLISHQSSIVEDAMKLPLALTNQQIIDLKERLAVYQLLGNFLTLHYGEFKNMLYEKKYKLMEEARRIWLASKQQDVNTLTQFLLGVFITDGKILRIRKIAEILAEEDMNNRQAKLTGVIKDQFS
jgi:metal-responsive CopG/Arc/MetJ family transcriptional regulator